MEKIGTPAEPALEMPFSRAGTAGEERLGLRARRFDQVSVLGEIGKAQERCSALAGAEIFARTAQLEILACDDESVGLLANHPQPLAGGVTQRILIEQHTHRLCRAASNASAQLVQLRKTKALRVLDHHR